MERDRVKAREEELVAMDETEYNKGLAMAILPDDYNYIYIYISRSSVRWMSMVRSRWKSLLELM